MAVPVRDDDSEFMIFFTKNGYVKKTAISEYNKMRNAGVIAIKLKAEDYVVNAVCGKDEELLVTTQNGRSLRFKSNLITPTGRYTFGVKSIQLDPDDKVISGEAVKKKMI